MPGPRKVIAEGSSAGKGADTNLFYNGVKDFAAQHITGYRELPILQPDLRCVRVLDIEACEVEHIICHPKTSYREMMQEPRCTDRRLQPRYMQSCQFR